MYWLIYLAILGITAASESFEAAPADVMDVKMVLMGMRHGNRNPGKFLKNDPNEGKWGLEGASELTSIGKQQAYSVGKLLRDRYGDLIPKFYNSDTVKALSSSANRCQMTLQLAMAGLFPPEDRSVWNNQVLWQPIPYTIDNPMLRMYAVDECKPQMDAWQPISEDNRENLVEWINRDKEVMQYIADKTGLNATSLSDMADVADNIMVMQMMNLEMPGWVNDPTLEGYNKTSMIKKILSFAEAHQIDCALYEPCQNMMAGHWLDNINDNIADRASGKSKRQIVAYTSHTEITLSLMMELGYNVHECPTSAGFVIEYAENSSGEKFVRFLYHEPDPKDPVTHHIYLAPLKNRCGTAETNNWCSLSEYNNRVAKQDVIDDWQQACDISTCNSAIVPFPFCTSEETRIQRDDVIADETTLIIEDEKVPEENAAAAILLEAAITEAAVGELEPAEDEEAALTSTELPENVRIARDKAREALKKAQETTARTEAVLTKQLKAAESALGTARTQARAAQQVLNIKQERTGQYTTLDTPYGQFQYPNTIAAINVTDGSSQEPIRSVQTQSGTVVITPFGNFSYPFNFTYPNTTAGLLQNQLLFPSQIPAANPQVQGAINSFLAPGSTQFALNEYQLSRQPTQFPNQFQQQNQFQANAFQQRMQQQNQQRNPLQQQNQLQIQQRNAAMQGRPPPGFSPPPQFQQNQFQNQFPQNQFQNQFQQNQFQPNEFQQNQFQQNAFPQNQFQNQFPQNSLLQPNSAQQAFGLRPPQQFNTNSQFQGGLLAPNNNQNFGALNTGLFGQGSQPVFQPASNTRLFISKKK